MEKAERAMEQEDEIFSEIVDEGLAEDSFDATMHDEDEFVQGSVDAEDLAAGFNATIPTREIDVDEDTQGDEALLVNGEELLTEFEVADAPGAVHGDEIELELDNALKTGRTVTKAREGD